jgi:hypothetical protein
MEPTLPPLPNMMNPGDSDVVDSKKWHHNDPFLVAPLLRYLDGGNSQHMGEEWVPAVSQVSENLEGVLQNLNSVHFHTPRIILSVFCSQPCAT